ncbi:MAG: hypothetical protein COB73_07225 [Flavobacteriaceae bacterium]|nr:MAG: hypothetical protein COB73_07225 [Flavobacteriaceae bacterium]
MKKGIKLTLVGITINLFIAGILIITTFGKFSDLTDILSDWPLNLGVGILALYISGNYIGKKITYLINEKKWNSIFTGIIGLLTILIIGIFFGSTVGFLQEGIRNINLEDGFKNALIDYYVKPLFWIILFGIIPTIFIGGIMGYGIKKTYFNERNDQTNL